MPGWIPLSISFSSPLRFAVFILFAASSVSAHKRRLPSNRDIQPVSHSYDAEYAFSHHDGWETIPISDLPYKYNIRASNNNFPASANPYPTRFASRRRSPWKRCKANPAPAALIQEATTTLDLQSTPTNNDVIVAQDVPQTTSQTVAPASSSSSRTTTSRKAKPTTAEEDVVDVTAKVSDTLSKVDVMKGLGSPEDVTITWYTGHDLKNPSCWPKSIWAPSDESFAAAVTLEGWKSKPGCFTFLELCNESSICIFVRVVDTCAGCKKGSKHVDLTKAAFRKLANLDTGILTVKMRLATKPLTWLEKLWGPEE